MHLSRWARSFRGAQVGQVCESIYSEQLAFIGLIFKIFLGLGRHDLQKENPQVERDGLTETYETAMWM